MLKVNYYITCCGDTAAYKKVFIVLTYNFSKG